MHIRNYKHGRYSLHVVSPLYIYLYPQIGDTSGLQTVQDGCSAAVRRDARRSCSRVSLNAHHPRGFAVIYASILSLLFVHICRNRMLLASAVVVWEWLNEHGRWRPYSPAVCHHIEAVIQSDPRCGSVVLGQVDPRLSPYIIDLHSMHQFRQDTGEGLRGAAHGAVVLGLRWRLFYCSYVHFILKSTYNEFSSRS